ncbi:MAG: ATP-binding cassette domain-containing protein [Candidatus Marinimicrobia bacterium]|nr:ATP-binding cassette domain-containing protein [Candidatus Neomarinimicrobiota bacterium]MBT3502657.1 ATP-binding cassette domain-containing protein [Candidatus Neomarinimicrobiota bacterium]MBT3839953.1 ATP-binding cassette domain-containing protein [Candidatus Neomarinimicrobiota bacterium]MBT4000172.1 ATP-binding cassette domain-containing protein [Candidatus Neomarinimicrobiota bacterium]MBT4281750.1 ATP-binding cassette domain-containing protein [Candidatus Neomarinimicrobiota bacterium
MIQIENLSKNYGDVKAVKSISFTLEDKEIVGFLGANGAGKSTTLKMITGFLTPTSGNVIIDGLNIIDDSQEIQKQIGYLPELNPLYSEMKVYEYLKFHAEIRGIKGHEFKIALEKVVVDCSLQGIVHRTIGECSKGYKQRIGLAASMIHNPKILILDEPVSGLDPNQIVEIRRLIKKLGKEKLVLMSSHILQEIQATVDRIIIINQGEIVADGSSEELITDSKGLTQLHLEILNANENDIQNMKAIIPSITISSIDKQDNSIIVSLEYSNSVDPRKDVFNYCVEKEWVLLEMRASKRNLEDIFRSLTGKGDSAHA